MTTSTPDNLTHISVQFSRPMLADLQALANRDNRSLNNYITHLMSCYLGTVDYGSLPETPPKRVKTIGWEDTKQGLNRVFRVPTDVKEEFYRVAELQGHKGSSLIKRLIRQSAEDTLPTQAPTPPLKPATPQES